MGIDRARAFFQAHGLVDRMREFAVSSATVELAAQAVGVIPARIAKTLSFEDGDGCVLIVAAGDARIDNKKFKAFFHRKATMLAPEAALRLTGYAVGGVCPFAIDPAIPVYLDVSMQRFDTVYPACGSANSAIELTLQDLFTLANAREWIDVCKAWREEV